MGWIAYRGMFFLIGLVSMSPCLFWLWKRHQREKFCTVQVAGTVKSIEEARKDKRAIYYPVIAYPVEGVEYIERAPVGFRRSYSNLNPPFSVGDSVTVFYDPSKPKRFRVWGQKEHLSDILNTLLFAVIGAVVMITAFISF